MKCMKSDGDCKLDITFYDNGDVLEFCTFCDFQFLHKFENIENNHLNPYKKED